MKREELAARTRQLIEEGERLQADPSMGRLRLWLQLSDDLLASAWGPMDRYHLAWLMVGKPKDAVRGRPMTAPEEAAYVREVAAQKTAALRMSLDAVERQGMPFVGEDRGLAPGQGMGEVPASEPSGRAGDDAAGRADGAASAAERGGLDAAATGGAQAAPEGSAAVPSGPDAPGDPRDGRTLDGAGGPGLRRSLPLDPALAERLAEARRRAAEHAGHGERRAPRPERMQR